MSSMVRVKCSVPQGSVFGPLLFIMYTSDLADLVSTSGVNLKEFADNNQLYIHCSITYVVSSATVLEQCIAAIGDWMSANRLKLNTDKTEVIWMASRHSARSLDGCSPSLTLGYGTAVAARTARLLGVTVMPDLLLEKHISTVSAKPFFRLRQLRRVRWSLDTESTTIPVHAFVTSCINYCRCLLTNTPQKWTDNCSA